MKICHVSRLAVLLMVGLFPAALAAEEAALTRVTAEGKASIIKDDVDSAKTAALDDARRKAVEQVGSDIVSETVVENFELVKDRVVARAKGYVHELKVLEEGREGNQYRMKIEAAVSVQSLKDDATLIYKEMNKPRMMVLVTEAKGEEQFKSSTAENTIVEFLMEKGFSMVDQATAKENVKKDELRLAAEGNAAAAAKIGLQSGAEAIIVGTAQVSSPESIRDVLYASKATVSLRAVKTDNAEIYATATVTEPGVEGVPEAAGQKAAKAASLKAARETFWKILKAWNEEQLHGQHIELILAGVKNFTTLKKIKGSLKKIRGIQEVIQRSFDSPTATLTITFQGDSNRLAEVLTSGPIEGLDFEVTAVVSGKIEAHLR